MPLNIISAPAGFGKTTLLIDWIKRHQIPVAWISLDKRDNDVLDMLSTVIYGLQYMADSIDGTDDIGKAALTMLQAPQPPHVETILTSLLQRKIVSRIYIKEQVGGSLRMVSIMTRWNMLLPFRIIILPAMWRMQNPSCKQRSDCSRRLRSEQ